jgi:3-deoxy-7-phosphoheptulonate synthase
MHGNTTTSAAGLKTRSVDKILAELRAAFEVHAALGSSWGGVHFELTGEDVTECVGGPQNITEEQLSLNYTTYCDPRLNYAQGMEVAFLMSKLLKGHRVRGGGGGT